MTRRRGRQDLKRRAGNRVEKETFAIVCEGRKTETIYFEGVRNKLRLSTATIFVKGLGADPLTVVKHAEQHLGTFDHVWAVFDVEAPQPHESLHRAIDRAQAKGVRVAVSNPCFELWLLLHFKDRSAYLDNDQAAAHIKACPCSYDDKGFDFDKTWANHREAAQRAVALDARQLRDHPKSIVDRNPWTTVHELMALLIPTE